MATAAEDLTDSYPMLCRERVVLRDIVIPEDEQLHVWYPYYFTLHANV